MPGDGISPEYRPPRSSQKPRGDFVVAKEMPGDRDGHRCWPPCTAQKLHGGFLASPVEMLGDGISLEYRPPRPSQKPRGDFFVGKEMPGDGDSHRCWRPHSAQKPRGTSWRRRARCQATAATKSLGRRAPTQKPRGDFVVAEEISGNSDGHRCRPPPTAQKPRGDF